MNRSEKMQKRCGSKKKKTRRKSKSQSQKSVKENGKIDEPIVQ